MQQGAVVYPGVQGGGDTGPGCTLPCPTCPGTPPATLPRYTTATLPRCYSCYPAQVLLLLPCQSTPPDPGSCQSTPPAPGRPEHPLHCWSRITSRTPVSLLVQNDTGGERARQPGDGKTGRKAGQKAARIVTFTHFLAMKQARIVTFCHFCHPRCRVEPRFWPFFPRVIFLPENRVSQRVPKSDKSGDSRCPDTCFLTEYSRINV